MTRPSRAAGPRRAFRPAFTLVELLVVIGIIALLIGILLPSLNRARAAAKQTVCASNMRQLGVGLTFFANDNNGELPLTQHGGTLPEQAWVFTLMPYLDDVHAIRLCPEHPDGNATLAQNGTTFVFNEYVAIPFVNAVGVTLEDFTKFSRLRDTPSVPLLFELSDEELAASAVAPPGPWYFDHTHSRSWFGQTTPEGRWRAMTGEIEPQRHGGKAELERPIGRTNVLYADMHVEAVEAGQMKRYAEEGDRDRNFCRPRTNND